MLFTMTMVMVFGFSKASVHYKIGPGKDSTQILVDDPIAASLDSLSQLNFFEKS